MTTAPAKNSLGCESRRVFSLIQKHGPLTKPDLAHLSGYQMSSLNRYLEPLLSQRLVAACGTADSTGGRRPALLGVCADRYHVIGVNIATVYLDIIIVDLKVNLLSRERYDIAPDALPAQVVRQVKESIDRQLARNRISRDTVLGIGLSSIGPFDRARRVILPPIVQHLDRAWNGFPIGAELEQACGFPVVGDNGANNAVIAEYLFGHGRGSEKVLGVRCGMSIKTSYIAAGSIVRTTNNVEDAFGHMSVDIDGPPCVCGNYGCIECYSSIPALVRQFVGEIKKGRISSVDKPVEAIGYLDILNAAEAGDAAAREVVVRAATMLGAGLANYINLIYPEVITFDGLIIRNSKLYYQTAVEVAQRKSSLLNGNITTKFIRTSHFEDPSTVGAAVLAMESFLLNGDNLNG